MAVAETIPLASEVEDTLLNETDWDDCHTTGTLESGLPFESSTRAVSRTGSCAPGCPDWPSPLRMRSVAGWPTPGVGGGVAPTLTVTVNSVVTMLLLGPKGVGSVLTVRN